MVRTFLIAAAMSLLGTNVRAQMVQFCLPGQGGVIACPCGNPPVGGGLGCDNFGTGPAQSGTLDASGTASLLADSVTPSLFLNATGENDTSSTCFWTGLNTLNAGVPHAAGVRCVTGGLKRLYPQPGNPSAQASGGAVTRPGGLDTQSISVRTAALYGTPIPAGQTRYYFCIYRDTQATIPCGTTSSTINLTNAGAITWAP